MNVELLTTAEVAEIAGVDVGTVNRWAREGRLSVVRQLPGIRGARVFDGGEVRKLLDAAPVSRRLPAKAAS